VGIRNYRRVLTHPTFAGLALHSDEELGKLLGTAIIGRSTVREWPLSCVQRIDLENGQRIAYKSQRQPTVEPEFYAEADSPLLPAHRSLGTLGDCAVLALDWVDAPPLGDTVGDEDDLLTHGRRLVAAIGTIGGRPPHYLDIGSIPAWTAVVGTALDTLTALIAAGRFRLTEPDMVARVRAWAGTDRVHAAITANPRLVHGDLTAEQVLVTPDGYRVLDWQRPVLGPPEIDLVALLVSRRLRPRQHVDPTLVGVFWLLRLHWAVLAQSALLPEHPGPLFDQWAAQAVNRILR
jgi:hypothetical protein